MAKFIFKMESILSVKEKLEEQAKAEYSIEIMKLRQEEEKLDELEKRKNAYQTRLYEAVMDTLNISEIKILEDSVENIKYNIKLQLIVIANQQKNVDKNIFKKHIVHRLLFRTLRKCFPTYSACIRKKLLKNLKSR